MRTSQRTSITFLGKKIVELEVIRELGQVGNPERRGRSGNALSIPMNPDFITPIVLEAVKKMDRLTPDSFSFETGDQLSTNPNIGPYEGVQGLKEQLGTMQNIMKTVFEIAARSDIDLNNARSNVFLGHVTDVIRDNWESTESIPSK